jgi:Ribosomal protein S5, C-terminal domain
MLAKSLGTTNPINMAKATVNALQRLRRPEEVAQTRGLPISRVLPYRKPEPEPEVAPEPETAVPAIQAEEPQAEAAPATAAEADAPEPEPAAEAEEELGGEA